MKNWNSAFCILHSALGNWLPDMDLNHDKQIQSLLCYRYTIGQAGASARLKGFIGQSSRQRGTGFQPVYQSIFPSQARGLCHT